MFPSAISSVQGADSGKVPTHILSLEVYTLGCVEASDGCCDDSNCRNDLVLVTVVVPCLLLVAVLLLVAQ